MKLFEFISILLEYKRNITAQKLGDKLVSASQRDGNKDIDTILNTLEQIDPTNHKQYVEWLCKQYINNQFRLEDYPRINDVLVKFENAKRRMPIRDINKYSFRSLEDEIDKIYNVDLSKDNVDSSTNTFPAVPDSKILYNGPLGQLSIPETEEASCELGRGTKWCTAANKNNRFDNYNSRGPLYVWRDKNGEKYQFHFVNDEDDDEYQFMDSKDDPIDKKTLKYFRTEHPVLKKLFNEQEKEILQNPYTALLHAENVIRGRFPEAEKVIMSNPETAYRYAAHVIRRRWPEAEKVIASNAETACKYAENIIRGRFPEAEKVIMSNPFVASKYAREAIKGRWPEAEKVIAKDPLAAYGYARYIIQGKWPEAEDSIASNPFWAESYADEVLKDPDPKTWGKRYLAGETR